jgi:5-methylcytosine-specific restriction endonuclease McrA
MRCACGCGEDAPIADRTDRKRNRVKGEPLRFVHGHNRRLPREAPDSKTCSKCQTSKPAAAFYRDKAKTSGLSAQCRECRKAAAKEWQQANLERHRELHAAWVAANQERNRELKRRWQTANPAKRAENENRRRVRKRAGRVEKVDPWAIYERDGGRCHICGRHVAKKDMSLDHLIPVSKGGDHLAVNIRLAHLRCNIKRGAGRMDAQLLLH